MSSRHFTAFGLTPILDQCDSHHPPFRFGGGCQGRQCGPYICVMGAWYFSNNPSSSMHGRRTLMVTLLALTRLSLKNTCLAFKCSHIWAESIQQLWTMKSSVGESSFGLYAWQPSLDTTHRTRLLGTTVILGVVTSEALYYSSNQFGSQISTIIPALIIPLLDVDVATLNHEYVAKFLASCENVLTIF